MDDVNPKTDSPWRDLKSEFDQFRNGPDMDAEWTFGGSDGPGHLWRLCRDGQTVEMRALWELFRLAGDKLAAAKGSEDLVPRRLLGEANPVVRWLSALRYLNLNVRVLATAEWRVEKGLIWDVVGASSYLCQAFASKYPRARVKRHAMNSYVPKQGELQLRV